MDKNQDEDTRHWSSDEDVPDQRPMLTSDGSKPDPLPHYTIELLANISRKNSRKRQQNTTSAISSFMNLLRSNVGVGLLSMPNAIQDAGYILGPLGILLMGMLAGHCMTILVRCNHALCSQLGVSSLDYADIAELALAYKLGFKRSSRIARYIINMFLITSQLGICCTYFLFVSENTGRLIEMSGGPSISTNTVILCMLPVVVLLSFVRSLKAITPLTSVANFCYLYGCTVIVVFSVITILQRGGVAAGTKPYASTGLTYALFFGNVIFSFEGIGVILPVENKIANPRLFTPILWLTISIVTVSFATVGVSGYLALGSELKPSITLQFPSQITSVYQVIYPIAILYLAIGTLGSYIIQFYVPMDIMEPFFLSKISRKSLKLLFQLVFRATIVSFTAVVPILVYNLKFLIDLIGAGSGSFLAITIPGILEMIVFSGQRRYGLPHKIWILKNLFIVAFGLIGAIFGTLLTIYKIVMFET